MGHGGLPMALRSFFPTPDMKPAVCLMYSLPSTKVQPAMPGQPWSPLMVPCGPPDHLPPPTPPPPTANRAHCMQVSSRARGICEAEGILRGHRGVAQTPGAPRAGIKHCVTGQPAWLSRGGGGYRPLPSPSTLWRGFNAPTPAAPQTARGSPPPSLTPAFNPPGAPELRHGCGQAWGGVGGVQWARRVCPPDPPSGVGRSGSEPVLVPEAVGDSGVSVGVLCPHTPLLLSGRKDTPIPAGWGAPRWGARCVPPIPHSPVDDGRVVPVFQEGVTNGARGAQPQRLRPLPPLQAGDTCGGGG